MSTLWGGIPSIDELVLRFDTSQYPQAGKIVPCLMCAKPLLMRPYSGVPDQICPDCMNMYNECAKLVCFHCRVVVARIKPGVTDSGYHVRKHAILHIDQCNVCFTGPELLFSTVIEIDQWERATGRQKRLYIPVEFKTKENNS
jgi:hypothetical protein